MSNQFYSDADYNQSVSHFNNDETDVTVTKDSLKTGKELKSNGRCPTCGERIIKEITSDQKRVFNKGMYVFERSNNEGTVFEIICPRCLQHIILNFNQKS